LRWVHGGKGNVEKSYRQLKAFWGEKTACLRIKNWGFSQNLARTRRIERKRTRGRNAVEPKDRGFGKVRYMGP